MKISRLNARLALVALVTVLFTGCMDNEPSNVYDPYKQLDEDIVTIDNYLTQAGISNVEKDPRGNRMVINGAPGTGLTALGTNKVKVNYSGRVLGNPTPFETGTVTGTELRGYIPGWQIALSTLPVGSNATVYIPSPLAYGNQEKATIPANSILVFDLTFVDIEETETEKNKLKADTTEINTYLSNKAIQTINAGNGLRYAVTQEGSGEIPGLYDQIKVKIVYKLFSNDQQSVLTQTLEPNDNFYSRVVDQINGLQIGLLKMKVGSKATLYVPSGLAYGPYPVTNSGATIMPANSNLIVEVELLDLL